MNENIAGSRTREASNEYITVHGGSDTVFVERQLLASTRFTSVFLGFSITCSIDEQFFSKYNLQHMEGFFHRLRKLPIQGQYLPRS